MASPRVATSLLLRTSRSITIKSIQRFRAAPISTPPRFYPTVTKPLQRRAYSQGASPSDASKLYYFQDIKSHVTSPKPSFTLIDAREPTELRTTGTIPSALNIPVTSAPEAFFLSPEEFEDKFGFERPGKGDEVVFYCKSGVRSRAAAELARQAGWEKVGEYRGSWNEWEAEGGEREIVK